MSGLCRRRRALRTLEASELATHKLSFRNRSSRRDQSGTGLTISMGEEGVVQVLQHILSLQPACLHYRQDALDEAAASFTPAAEASLAPQDRSAQQPFHEIVGRFHSL